MSFRHIVSQPTAGAAAGPATAAGAAGAAAGATAPTAVPAPKSFNTQLTLGSFINGNIQHNLNIKDLKNVLAELPLTIIPQIIQLPLVVIDIIGPDVLVILYYLVEYCKNNNVTISYANQSRKPTVIFNHLGQIFTKVEQGDSFKELRPMAGVSKSAEEDLGSGDVCIAMAKVPDFAESIPHFIEDANIDISREFDLRNESMYLLAKKPAKFYAAIYPFLISQGNNDKKYSYVVSQLPRDLKGGYIVVTREL